VLAFVYAFLPGDDEVRKAALDDAWARLFAPAENGGTLSVASEVDGAEVFVDTIRVGETPLPFALTGVLPGEHVVEVKKAGHEPLRSQPAVGVGEEVELYALLAPEENDPAVPVVEPSPPLDLADLPVFVIGAGTFFVAAGGIAALWGMAENLRRNAEVDRLLVAEGQYYDRSVDVTDASDAAALARSHGIIEGQEVPFWSLVGGSVTFGLGAIVIGGGVVLMRLEGE